MKYKYNVEITSTLHTSETRSSTATEKPRVAYRFYT